MGMTVKAQTVDVESDEARLGSRTRCSAHLAAVQLIKSKVFNLSSGK
jgi:hypothetical protein